MKNILCIYHGNCADGFTSAWVFRKYMNAHQDYLNHNVEYFAGFYGNDAKLPDVAGKHVYMLDFSYKRDVLLKLAEKAEQIIILDHHESAEKDLVNLPKNVIVIFDMKRSGAGITWDYFFPTIERPTIVKLVEDRDLWRFRFENTRVYNANLFSYEYTFENWDKIASQSFGEILTEGAAIERKHFKDIRELLPLFTRDMKIAGYVVPVTNVPYTLGSDACNELAKGKPFAGYYSDKPTGRLFGLRSVPGEPQSVNVGEIATALGGGGHKHASGFMLSYEQAARFEMEKN